MIRAVPAALAAALSAASGVVAAENLKLEDETARINYSVGYQIGGDFKRQGVELDAKAVVKGIEDALAGGETLMTPQEMRTTLVDLKKKIVAEQQRKRGEEGEKRRVEGRAFMEQNAQNEGVQTTESGLQYKIVEEGSGKSPAASDTVTVNYKGTLIDGKEFDSSYKRGKPATFQLNRVIKGWSEGLQLMKEGGKAEFVIPPGLAYGDRGPLGDRTLIFEVELLSVGEAKPETGPAKAASGQ
jgi:FKBP-type peptidyl-prolyl cis-trans isomerase FklB